MAQLAFSLKGSEVAYSESELRLFGCLNTLIKTKGHTDTELLNELFWSVERAPPFHAKKTMVSTLSYLIKKMEANNEMFEIVRQHRGPKPMLLAVQKKILA